MGQAGGLKRLPLLLFGLGIVLVVDLQGFLLYNIGQQGMSRELPHKALFGLHTGKLRIVNSWAAERCRINAIAV